MKLSQRLKQARKAKGLTQNKLAKISGVTQQSISNIERGTAKGSALIVDLANALQVNPSWLANGTTQLQQKNYTFSKEQKNECNETSPPFYSNEIIDKEIQEVIEYAIDNQLKEYFLKLSPKQQVNLIFELYESTYKDNALLNATKNMNADTLLKIINS